MFSFFNKKLTAASNYYVDWSRAGELILSGKHRYSPEEIATRGAIVLIAAGSSLLAYNQNNEEITHCSNMTIAIAAGVIGFAVSHTIIAVVPLAYKRYKMSVDCSQLVSEMNKKTVSSLPDMSRQTLQSVIERILNLSLSNEKHSNASLTWGTRKALLNRLKNKLEDEDDELLYSLEMGDVNPIFDNLVNTASCIKLRR